MSSKLCKDIKFVWFTVHWVSSIFEVEAWNCSIDCNVRDVRYYVTDYCLRSLPQIIIIISSIYITYILFLIYHHVLCYSSSSLSLRSFPWWIEMESVSVAPAPEAASDLQTEGRQIKKQKLKKLLADDKNWTFIRVIPKGDKGNPMWQQEIPMQGFLPNSGSVLRI